MNQPEVLTDQLKDGDPGAFANMVRLYQDMVYNTALGMVQNTADADDITQEVFVQVFNSIKDFKGESKLSTWIYRITISKTLDHERRKKRKKRFGFVQSLFSSSEDEAEHPAEFNHPGVLLEKKESAAALFSALKKLPAKQRTVFTLHKIEGQSYHEIATILNTSLYAVESVMKRAKENLRKSLNEFYILHAKQNGD